MFGGQNCDCLLPFETIYMLFLYYIINWLSQHEFKFGLHCQNIFTLSLNPLFAHFVKLFWSVNNYQVILKMSQCWKLIQLKFLKKFCCICERSFITNFLRKCIKNCIIIFRKHSVYNASQKTQINPEGIYFKLKSILK